MPKKMYNKDVIFENNGEEYEMSEDAQKEIDDFEANATVLIHSEETRDVILNQLKSGQENRVKTVADVAYNIFRKIETSRAEHGASLNEFTMVTGAEFIVNEIIDIGSAAGVVNLSEEERILCLQASIEKYIHMGIKQGRISEEGVVELQRKMEPLMKEHAPQMYEQGMQIAEQQGLEA